MSVRERKSVLMEYQRIGVYQQHSIYLYLPIIIGVLKIFVFQLDPKLT